jgi:hypothetical protein
LPEAHPTRCSRRRRHPGAQGPVAESRGRNGHGCLRSSCGQWVRAHRQLHAGNTGLRPATTSFPSAPLDRLWMKLNAAFSVRSRRVSLPFPVSTCTERWVAHTPGTRPALTKVVSQKMAKTALSIARQRSRDYAEQDNRATEKMRRICARFCGCVSPGTAQMPSCMVFRAPPIVESM